MLNFIDVLFISLGVLFGKILYAFLNGMLKGIEEFKKKKNV
jgi:hypothetical protein